MLFIPPGPPYNWAEANQEESELQTAGGYKLSSVSVVSSSQAMALSCAPQGTPNVYKLNGQGGCFFSSSPNNCAWVAVPGSPWLANAQMGADGSIWGTSGYITWAYINGAWAQMASSPLMDSIAVGSAHGVWGVSKKGAWGVLERWSGTAWVPLSPAPSFIPAFEQNKIAAAGDLSISVVDVANTLHVSEDGGNTWSTIAFGVDGQGPVYFVTGGGTHLFVLASPEVEAASPGSYHVASIAPVLAATGSALGSTLCPRCAANDTITLTVYSSWANGAQTSASASGSPSQLITASPAAVASAGCDLFNPSCPVGNCQPWYKVAVTSVLLGTILNETAELTDLPQLELEAAFTQAYWNGAPAPSCGENGACVYQVHNNCTAATTPPDMGMIAVISGNFVGDSYVSWMNAGACVRPITGGTWACLTFPPVISWINSVNVPLLPYPCTHNP
jgi:hypothetical protein